MRKRSRIQNLSLCLGGFALAGVARQANAQIAVDGTLDSGYGSALATQTVNTGYGDSTIGDGTSGGGSELDAGYGVVQNGELYVFIAGNFENNGNHVDLFINDGRSGGQAVLNASTASGNLNAMNGSVFSPGFSATYAIDANDYANTLYIDQYDLVKNTANYLGSVPLTGGIGNSQNLTGLKVALNNTNAAGVVGDGGTGTAADPTAANAVKTGLEIGIPLAALGNPAAGSNIEIMADLNGGGNNYLSNQFLAGLPVGTTDLGAGGQYTGPSAGTFNLATITDGWFNVAVPSAVPNGTWLPTGGGTWGTGTNWSNGYIPHVAGDSASFSSATGNSTVSLGSSNFSVGSMSFSNANSYTIASTGGILTFDNGASMATVTDYGGAHIISAPVVLNSNTNVTVVNHGDTVTISGNISGAGALSTDDLGGGGAFPLAEVILSGNNSYSGGTVVDSGNLQLGSSMALPTGTALTLSAVDVPAGVLDLNGFSANVSSITVLTGPNTVALGAVGQIINTSTLAATATLTYAGTIANPSNFTGNINDSAGSGGGSTALTVASGSLTLSGNNTYAGGTTVNSGASLILSSTAGTSFPIGGNVANNGSLVVNDMVSAGNISGTGTTTVNSAMSLFAIGFTQAGLVNNGSTTVSGSGTVGPISGTGTLTVGGTLHLAANSGLSTQGDLVINTGGTFDIANNHVILSDPDGSLDSTIFGYLASGRAGGAWNGPGIDSSTAALPANKAYAVGFADGADKIVTGLSSGQLELKYTLLGDANLDGLVTGDDFTILVGNLGKSGIMNWDKGNFLYNSAGTITGDDFTALVGNLGKSANGADVAIPAADYAAIDAFAAANGLMADVPEPASAGLLLAAGLGFMGRRRRNSHSSVNNAR